MIKFMLQLLLSHLKSNYYYPVVVLSTFRMA